MTLTQLRYRVTQEWQTALRVTEPLTICLLCSLNILRRINDNVLR